MKTSAYPTYDVFIFDFDGTLVDSRRNIAHSFNFALAQMALQEVNPEQIYPLIGKLTLEDTFKRFYPQLDAPQISGLIHTFRQHQRENVKLELTFFPEALSTLTALRARNRRLAILTTKNIEQIEYILDVLAVRGLFQAVCGMGSLPQIKPDKACIEFVWSCLNIQNGQECSVMVGDSETDVATAHNAGIAMIAVGHGVDSLDYLVEKGATYTVQSLSELLRFA